MLRLHLRYLAAAAFTALLLILPSDAHAQRKKDLIRENAILKDSTQVMRARIRELEEAQMVRNMTEVRDERELRFLLTPDEFNQEATDSLLDIWYIHRKFGNQDFCGDFDIDSMEITSNVPDSVYIKRLEGMNSIIPLPYNEVVRKYIILYSEKMPSSMKRVIGLCSYYMPIFQEAFNRYGLPEELKAMSIIESMLNPTAVSRAGAKGAWQFMYASGKAYGLDIDSYVDERLDPEKSADAAARYLLDSYNIFGDWSLAIASYNCGPGNVNKA
ncbi:MAG: lytic transglycosylase domain-containing protein, partial [Bacteroidales bacterium]|nr:lytic transglycosylase domain-containing protein [Bacteroidales bacterium]